MPDLISLAEAKEYLRKQVTSTEDDVKIQAAVSSATVTIERHLGVIFRDDPEEVTEYHYCATGVIYLRTLPVVEVTSVQYRDGSHSWDVDSLLVDLRSGRVTDTIGSLVGDITVVYTAGQATVPENVKDATKEIVRWLWESQGPGRSLDARFGSEESTPTGYGWSDIPNRAKVLLGERVSGLA